MTGNVFVAKTAEAFTYDADGNLTSDGRWTNRWDAENRLIRMETLSAVPTGAKKALGFSYDARGRRISLVVSNWSGSAWANVAAQTRRFVYDDWNLLAALDGNNARVQSFVWGSDLSGSIQGAGGVGGLLAVNDAANGVHFAAYDGNGKLWLITDDTDLAHNGKYRFFTTASKTVIAPACSYMWAITMGAGPDQLIDKDELIANFNRLLDVALPLEHPMLVTSFQTADEGLRFLDTVDRRNKTMTRNFLNTTLEYELFPTYTYTGSGWDEFNSNSYISGLLRSFGYRPPLVFDLLPGYRKPIPSFVFTMSFSSNSALKAEWRKHFPEF